MAAITGIKGSIDYAGATDMTGGSGAQQLLATKWSGSFDMDVHEVTPFDPTGRAKLKIAGLHDFSGTIEGFLDDTTTHDISHFTDGDVPAASDFELYAHTSRSYIFAGLLSNFSVNTDVQGPNTWTANFTSSGVVAVL